jgi:glycosyltransferase involved in cell wall biosynthesis
MAQPPAAPGANRRKNRLARSVCLANVTQERSPEPAVDIGMPAFRRPQFIGEAIESVLSQTHANWRLVVSENGPGGGEVEAAVRPYTDDPRIRYVATGENLGPAANWTRLIQAGSSPYVTLVQDDDRWDPDFLSNRVRFLDAHDSCGFVFSGTRAMDRDGREISVERTRSLATKDVSQVLPEGVYAPREFFPVMYRHQLGGIHTPAICSVGVMSRRSALEAVGAHFDESYPFLFWDVELYVRMALRFPTGFLAVRDATQRLHHPSLTSEASSDGELWIRWHDYHGEWIRRGLPGIRLPRQFDQLRSKAYIMAALDTLERGDRRRSARYLTSAVRAYPPSLLNPRVSAGAIGLLLGGRGARALRRARAGLRRDRLAYEPVETKRA